MSKLFMSLYIFLIFSSSSVSATAMTEDDYNACRLGTASATFFKFKEILWTTAKARQDKTPGPARYDGSMNFEKSDCDHRQEELIQIYQDYKTKRYNCAVGSREDFLVLIAHDVQDTAKPLFPQMQAKTYSLIESKIEMKEELKVDCPQKKVAFDSMITKMLAATSPLDACESAIAGLNGLVKVPKNCR